MATSIFERIAETAHEQVVFCNDQDSGYRSIIAIHSTVLGPAMGGTRFWQYARDEDAVVDALRLSRGMTYKNAVAGLALGGGKAVIMRGEGPFDRERLFRAHGKFVDRLNGLYVTAEDVGTTTADMDLIRLETRHVAGLASEGGDPSPWTARGVFRGIQASAQFRWGSDDLSGKTIAIQGCGNVGYHLGSELHRAGAQLIVADINQLAVKRCVEEFDAIAVRPEDIYDAEADVLAPCALGGILNDDTISRLDVEIVAGGSNNQLQSEQNGQQLMQRKILYAPDYVINAGGVISGSVDLLGWAPAKMMRRVEAIYDTLVDIYRNAERHGIPPHQAADRLAEEIIGRGKAPLAHPAMQT